MAHSTNICSPSTSHPLHLPVHKSMALVSVKTVSPVQQARQLDAKTLKSTFVWGLNVLVTVN